MKLESFNCFEFLELLLCPSLLNAKWVLLNLLIIFFDRPVYSSMAYKS